MNTELQPNVLLVDDRPENLFALEAILEPLGARLVRATSGQEALKHLLREEYAVILLDVQMPILDGFETAALIKERDKTRHVPIIFVTAISTDEMYVSKGYVSGAVDYIAKPFNPDILRSKVAVFLELFRKTEQVKHQSILLMQSEQDARLRVLAERERDLERQHVAALAESQEHLRRFKETLDATLDGVFIFDAKTLCFVYANEGATEQLGYDLDVLLRMTPLDIQSDYEEPQYRNLIEPLLRGEVPSLTMQTQHTRRDGEVVPVEVFLQYIVPQNGAAHHSEYSLPDADESHAAEGAFVAISRDITERKRMEDSLISARDEAERANQAKSEFISSVSHELRTPLNAIIGFSKLLLNPHIGPLNEDQGAYMQDIVQSAEHLLQLINDILDLSKIEAGKLSLHPAPFPLVELLDGSLSIVREKARLHSIELGSEYTEETTELVVHADQRKVKQILFNLLSNAVKFTPDGGSVTIGARCEYSRGEEVVIFVRDTGVGIPLEHQNRIFGAFEQVDSTYTRHSEGTGLGLALTQRLVSLHGGRIWLESEPGIGSTFFVGLPLESGEEAVQTEVEADAPLAASH
jgi:PAS domain S-box-containing protein